MNQFFTKCWLLMTMLWVATYAYSYDFEADGIYYLADVSNMTAAVASGESPYEGNLVIPATTSYKGRDFSVTSIESHAFLNCYNLESITLPESINSIGVGTFMNCSKLASINIPKNISNLPTNCFNGCSSLESVNLPSSIIEIGSDCFANCNSLTAIAIPESVTSLGERAFLNCENLISIVLPNTINKLSKELFQNCLRLTDFTIPSSIEFIEDGVFENCENLLSISIPADVREIGNGVFNGCGGLLKVCFEPHPTLISVGYNNTDTYVKSPLFNDCPLSYVVIGRNIDSASRDRNNNTEGCFSRNPCLSEVVLNGCITSIEEGAFKNCVNLTSIEIPRSVVSIGDWAFTSSGLEKVVFEDGYVPLTLSLRVSKGDDKTPKTFSSCNIVNLYLGRTLQIGDAWQNPAGGISPVTFFPETLRQVVIGDYVDNIDVLLMKNQVVTSSLANYPNLIDAQFGENLGQLPSLENNDLLEQLSISSSVPPLAQPFTNSQYMELNVDVPKGFLAEYKDAPIWKNFWNLSQNEDLLQCIEVNDIRYKIISDKTLEVIKKSVEYAENVKIPSMIEYDGVNYEVISLGEAFEGCTKLISVSVPSTVHSLLNNCFMDCVSLQCVELNDGLKSIGKYAFNNCTSLKTLSIPSSVDMFGVGAFAKCEFDSLRFEDGETELAFPHSYYSYDGFPGGWGGWKTYKSYFSNVSIKYLYLGRNLKNIPAPYVEKLGGITYYYLYEDPFYNLLSLQEITIGAEVSKIGSDLAEPIYQGISNNYRSFCGCKNVEYVNVKNDNPPMNAIFANNVYVEASLSVPENTKELYQEAKGWKEFMNIFDGTEPVLVEEIRLNVTEVSLEIGDTFQLTAEVLPEDATDQSVIWESSNLECVSVDANGLLTALAEGVATIMVRSTDGNCEATCLVSVIDTGGSVDAINSAIGGEYSVFNLQGIKVLESKDADKLKQLPNGVYIVNGKKIVIK